MGLAEVKLEEEVVENEVKESEATDNSFSRYPPHFQTNLVKLIIEDRLFASQMQEVLELKYFDQSFLKEIVNLIFIYKDKYGTHPATETIDMLFSNIKNINENEKQAINSFWSAFKKNRKIEDPDFYMKIALDFCRSKKLLDAIEAGLPDLKEANIDEFMEKLSKAASLGSSQNFGHDYQEDFEKRYETDLRDTITLGDELLDEYTGGGISTGELFVIVAPRSKGKTSRMVRAGAANLKLGRNVVYFHMEMKSSEIGQKFDSAITELYLKDLKDNKDTIRKTLEELPGKLRIIEEEYCATTPRRIFNKCRKLEDSGFKIDLVIIDYMDICIPTKQFKDDDGSAGGIQVYAEVKNLGKKYDYRVLTGAQTNRAGNEAEVITTAHFEGRIARFNPCDFVVGFSSFGKASPLKTRVGEDGWILNEYRDFGRVYSKLSKPDTDTSIDRVVETLQRSKPKDLASNLHNFLAKKQ